MKRSNIAPIMPVYAIEHIFPTATKITDNDWMTHGGVMTEKLDDLTDWVFYGASLLIPCRASLTCDIS